MASKTKNKSKQKKQVKSKLLIDGTMWAVILGAMVGKYAGNILHEITGVIMFNAVLIHLLQHRKWVSLLFKGRYRWRRILDLTLIILLFAATITLLVSGMMMSRSLFTFLGVESDLSIRQIHTTAGYWLVILSGIHIGVHSATLISICKKHISLPSGVAVKAFLVMLQISTMIFAIWAFVDRDMFAKLFMIYAFDFWNPDQPVMEVLFSYLAVTMFCAIITHRFLGILPLVKRGKWSKQR